MPERIRGLIDLANNLGWSWNREARALFRTIDEISAEARRVRLDLGKLVDARKLAIKGEIVADGVAKLKTHIDGLNTRLGKSYMPNIPADFGGVIKGKRSVSSIRDAVGTELSRTKIAANDVADKIQTNLTTLRELAKDHVFLFSDTSTIVLKPCDDLTVMVKSRIAEHQAEQVRKDEETRECIRQEEQVKAKRVADLQAQQQNTPVAPAVNAPPATNSVAPNVVTLTARAPAKPTTPPSLKLGAIADRLGFTLTADFLKGLGFEPAATDRSSKLYHEADFTHICAALVDHINGVQSKQAA